MSSQHPTEPRHRLAVLQLGLAGWAVLVLVRLFWLQVSDHAHLAELAMRQQERHVALPAQRGAIYDRNLTPLAMTLPVQSLFADPHLVQDPQAEAARLAPVLDLERNQIQARLDSRLRFVWLERQLTAAQSAALDKLHLPGVFTQPATRRFYPKGPLAASLLGFVGIDGHGLGGIEHQYDRALAGRSGDAVVEVDAHRREYSQIEKPPVEGKNLVLTIDQNIQYIAQQELDRQVAAEHARHGTVIVERPQTGEILALANSPSFNPDDYQDAPAKDLGDAAVTSPYEPGSVFKLVTLSAGLQQHLITPQEIINCGMGSIFLGGRIIHDHARFGLISVTDILKHSSDVGAIKIGLKLGDDELYHYIRAYGFGRKTGIGLPGESPGIVRPPREWQPMSIGAISMGQEIAVTPIQVVAMIGAIADGGVYHAPRVVMDSFRGPRPAQAPRFSPQPGRRIVSELVANQMKQMMAQVVLGGTGVKAQLNGYTVGGKTGTAQMVDPGTHAYSKTDYVASFGGFAPLNDPAVVILVVINSPHNGSYEGGDVSAPVFKAIAERVLPYLGVPHDVPVAAPAVSIAARGGGQEPQPAEAPLPLPTPVEPSTVPLAQPTWVAFDYGRQSIVLPDFTGQSARAVAADCQRLGLVLSVQGSGVATEQAPAPGTHLAPGDRVTVRFSP